MKYLLVLILCVAFVVPCYAGMEKSLGDVTVGLSDVNIGTAYDFNQGEWLGVVYSSVVKYKSLSLDLGAFKDLDNLQESSTQGIMAGIGLNVTEKDIPKTTNPKLSAGVFLGTEANKLDEAGHGDLKYGIYTTLKFKF